MATLRWNRGLFAGGNKEDQKNCQDANKTLNLSGMKQVFSLLSCNVQFTGVSQH
jgi:hypothetical protein